MKVWLQQLFSEQGGVSMMRVLSLICVLTASAIALDAIAQARDLSAAAILVTPFLSAGIAGKAWQRSIEQSQGKAGSSDAQ